MKRFFSWIVLALSIIICSLAISFVSYYAVKLAAHLYDASRGVFWAVIFLGGSFGLGIGYYAAMITAPFCVKISNTIRKSIKGTRYIVFAIITIVYYVLNIISSLALGTRGNMLASSIVTSVFMIIFSIVLILSGKEATSEN